MQHRELACVVALLVAGCGDAFVSFEAGVGGASVGGAAGGSAAGGSAADGGAGGAASCEAPDGWATASLCTDGGLELGLVPSEASCDPCACDVPDGARCTTPYLQCQVNATCMFSAEWVSEPIAGAAPGACFDGPSAGGPWYCRVSGAAVYSAAPATNVVTLCEPNGGAVEGAAWASTLRLCDGCGCVARQGEYECPDPTMTRTVGYAGARDGRSCSACSCTGAPSCPTSPTAELHADAACVGGVVASVAWPTCTAAPSFDGGSFTVTETTPSAEDCEPAGGAPSGEVAPEEPWTVCCAAT